MFMETIRGNYRIFMHKVFLKKEENVHIYIYTQRGDYYMDPVNILKRNILKNF